jgi:hypothetical protein
LLPPELRQPAPAKTAATSAKLALGKYGYKELANVTTDDQPSAA